MDASRLPVRITAALSALADPDAQAPASRTLAYLAWAVLLSVALHAAALTWLGTIQFSFGGPIRLALSARLVSIPATTEHAGTDPASKASPREASPGSDAATLPHLYFTSREVDVPAAVLEKPPLIYPENPYLWKLRGTVRVRVFIGEDGRVDTVELVSAEPAGHFEEAALAAARQLRYRPAAIRGQAVRSRKLIEILFDPHEHLRPAAAPPAGGR